MFLSHFLSLFIPLNLLFYNLCLIMPMLKITEDMLQLSVVFQVLTLSSLFPIYGFIIFFQSIILFFFPHNIICENSLRAGL